MKVLFVSTWFPHPLDTGSRIRVNHLLRALTARHQVHLVSFMPAAESAQAIPGLLTWCEQVEVVERDPFRRDPLKAWLGYLSPRPRDVVATYSREMARRVAEAARGQRYDAAIASCSNAAPYVAGLAGPARLLEEHNFLTRWMEEQFRAQPGPAREAARWITWQKCRRYERGLYPRFDACTVVSEQDRRAVEAAIPACAGRVEVVPNGVDTAWAVPGLAEPEPDRLVFNGALSYYANADAMRFFVAEILPALRRERPGVRLRITGGTEGADLPALGSPGGWLPQDGSVQLTGRLEDVRPAVAGSWACVVPLRIGGGTRLKILEAMALGTPVVATSKGAEGLEVTPEWDILLADEPAAFATQTARLLADPELRRRLAENGRRLVESRYDWQQIGRRFCDVVEAMGHGQDGQAAQAWTRR